MELGHTSNLDLKPQTPNLKLASHIGTLILCANFAYHKLVPNWQRRKKSRGTPLYNAFFWEGKAALSLQGLRANFESAHPGYCTRATLLPPVKQDQTPIWNLKPQTLNPPPQTLPSKFQLLHLHTYSNPKPQNLKPQTSNLISQTSTLKPRVGVGGMSRRRWNYYITRLLHHYITI